MMKLRETNAKDGNRPFTTNCGSFHITFCYGISYRKGPIGNNCTHTKQITSKIGIVAIVRATYLLLFGYFWNIKNKSMGQLATVDGDRFFVKVSRFQCCLWLAKTLLTSQSQKCDHLPKNFSSFSSSAITRSRCDSVTAELMLPMLPSLCRVLRCDAVVRFLLYLLKPKITLADKKLLD